jgi:hypothetical protein
MIRLHETPFQIEIPVTIRKSNDDGDGSGFYVTLIL